jgi:hypothetical protein
MRTVHGIVHSSPSLALFVGLLAGLSACSGSSTKVSPPKTDSGSQANDLGGNGSSGGGGGSSGGSSGASSSSGAGIFGDEDATSAEDGGPTDATTGSDTAVAADAGVSDSSVAPTEASAPPATCQPPSGGAACDPGTVTCGGVSCSTGDSVCCTGEDGGGSCAADNSAGCPGGDLSQQCDETGDCSSGVCCEEVIGLGVAGPTQCMASCPSGWFQVCKSNTECGTGDGGGLNRCVLQTCTQPPGLLTPGSSVVVEACAQPAGIVTIDIGTTGPSGALAGCVAQ